MLAQRVLVLPRRYCGPTATISLLPDGTTRVQEGLHRPPPVRPWKQVPPGSLPARPGCPPACPPLCTHNAAHSRAKRSSAAVVDPLPGSCRSLSCPLCSQSCFCPFQTPRVRPAAPPPPRLQIEVTDPRWGTFRQRGTALSGEPHGGIPILAFDVVSHMPWVGRQLAGHWLGTRGCTLSGFSPCLHPGSAVAACPLRRQLCISDCPYAGCLATLRIGARCPGIVEQCFPLRRQQSAAESARAPVPHRCAGPAAVLVGNSFCLVCLS